MMHTPFTFKEFLAIVHEDWASHGRDWTLPGFRAVAVNRFGNWRMGLKPKLVRAPFSVLYRMMYRFVRNHYGIELQYTTKVGRRVIIEHQGDIAIHGHAVIGDDSIIRQGCTLGLLYLDRPLEAPTLGQRVSVGIGAKLAGGITIGDDVQIGPNAVITNDVPAKSMVMSVPSRTISPPPSKEEA